MCKFQQPQIPADATADEKRAIYFNALCSLDLSDKVEKYNDLTYVSWANAWAEFKGCYPSATYRIIKNPETNLPYFADPLVGIMVYTEVTVEGITHEMWLPVMNNANKAMKLEAYTYQVWDKEKRQYVGHQQDDYEMPGEKPCHVRLGALYLCGRRCAGE